MKYVFIGGPAASGKSTLAHEAAKECEMIYFCESPKIMADAITFGYRVFTDHYQAKKELLDILA